MKQIFQFLVICSLLISVGCASRIVPLYNPPPINVPANQNFTEIGFAVKRALVSRGWRIQSDQPGIVRARQERRGHAAQVVVVYNRREVTVRYKESENLEYMKIDNSEMIHRTYNTWAHNLELDIQKELFATAQR